MKMKHRVLSLLIAMAVMITFMPAMAFAGNEDEAATKTAGKTKQTQKTYYSHNISKKDKSRKDISAKDYDDDDYYVGGDYFVSIEDNDYIFKSPSVNLTVPLYDDVNENDLSFTWAIDTTFNDLYAEWETISGETGRTITVTQEGNYRCFVQNKYNRYEWDYCYFWADLGWEITNDGDEIYIGPNEKASLSVETSYKGSSTIYYSWYRERYDAELDEYYLEPIPGATRRTYVADSADDYYCCVMIDGKALWGYFDVSFDYQGVYRDGLWYELNSTVETDQAGVFGYDDDAPPQGSITVQPAITLANGKTYSVTELYYLYGLQNVTSITIPASVTEIEEMSIGYYGYRYDAYYDEYVSAYYKVNNFTIFGKTGSAAQRYAAANGFAFRDPEAEAAEARRQAEAAEAQRQAEAAEAQRQSAAAEAQRQAAEALAAASNINKATVSASDIKKASTLGATTVTLGPKVKKIKKNAFKGTGITTIIIKSKKLKAGSVKGSLRGSRVKTVKVKVGKAKDNKRYKKTYRKIFTKSNAGKSVSVK